ncbi:MAG: hypothetical protein RR060_05730, partial [Victivallaceae bacterium]
MNNLWRFLGVLALAGMVQNGWSAERSELPVTLSALPETAEGRWETLTPPAVKIIAGKQYGEILGMHIIGPRATDLICEGALAIRLEATLDELVDTIHSHPTVTETVRE